MLVEWGGLKIMGYIDNYGSNIDLCIRDCKREGYGWLSYYFFRDFDYGFFLIRFDFFDFI